MKQNIKHLSVHAMMFLSFTALLFVLTSCSMEKPITHETTVIYDDTDAQIIQTVDNVGSYADSHNWGALADIFADEVVLDYESFTGEPAETLTPDEIISRWSAFLPGFDVTQHKNLNHKIVKSGNSYLVTTDVRATHSIEGAHAGTQWIVDGSYDFVLDSDLKITHMKLNFEKTLGNNDLPNIALSRAKFDSIAQSQTQELSEINDANNWIKPANPIPSEQEENENIKVVQNFFAAYGANDLDAIRNVMSDDVTWYIPGKHKLAGTKKGVDEVVAFFGLLQKAGFMAEPLIFAANDNYVIDAHRGYSTTGENDIDMNWVLIYKIEDGKIAQVQNFSADSYSADAFFDSVYNYDDASKIRTNLQTNTTHMEKISFDSNGTKVVGNIYYPENYDPSKKHPGVVVMGSWTTVKEQMAGTYAEEMSKKGFITLAFDPRGFGESHADIDYYESPQRKVEDIDNAVAYLKSRNDVEKIGAFGVCAGGGYTLVSASDNDDIDVVATVASWIHDSEAVKIFYGGEQGVQEKISAAQAAKKKFKETGEVEYIAAISETDETAAMYGPYDYYLNPERGAVPEWKNDKFAVASWEDWLTFDPSTTAKDLNKPTIMVHSDGAVLPEYTKTYFENISTDNKELVWLETDMQSPFHQFSFYDSQAEINKSIDSISEFFHKNLK